MAQCIQCQHPLPDANTVEEAEFLTKQPCPSCGGFGRNLSAQTVETLEFHDHYGMRLKRPGRRGYAVDVVARPDFNRDRQKLVRLDRVINKENDKYYEKITDYQTGEIIREVSEPLSEHVGRGAAKLKKPKGSS
jgi:hypothetical protein